MIVVRGIVTIYSASSFSVAFYNELAQAPNPWEQYNHSLMSCIRTRDWGFGGVPDKATGPTCYPECSHNLTSGFNGNKAQFVLTHVFGRQCI